MRQLFKTGCKKVFRETASGAKTDRSPHDSPHFTSARILRRFALIPYQNRKLGR